MTPQARAAAPRRKPVEPRKPLHRLDRRRPDRPRAGRGPARRRAAEVPKASSSTSPITSVLKRAIRTLWTALDEMDRMWIPVVHSWRLNERHYGALQGLNKAETAARFGEEQVLIWRRAYAIAPDPLPAGDPRGVRPRPALRRGPARDDPAHRVPEGHGRAGRAVLERVDRARRSAPASACWSRRTATRCARWSSTSTASATTRSST